MAYWNQGQTERAIADLDEAIRLDPRDAEAYLSRGSLYEELGNAAAARADYQSALKIVPDHPEAREALARVGN